MPTKAFSAEWRLLSLERAALEHSRIDHYRDSYFPYADPHSDNPDGREAWTKKTAVVFDADILRYGIYGLYWKNEVGGMETDRPQFREVGWKWRLGLKVHERIDFFHDHHSRHILDDTTDTKDPFPVQDFYGVSVELYKRK